MSRFLAMFSGVSVAVLSACGGGGSSPLIDTGPPDLTLAELMGAPEELAVGSRTLTMETSLLRNRTPTTVPPLMLPRLISARLTVTERDLNPLPLDITLRWVWYVHDDRVLAVAALPEASIPDTPPFEVTKVSACPDDGEPEALDVIIGLEDGAETLFLVRAADQPVTTVF